MKTALQNTIWLIADGLNILEEVVNHGYNKIGQKIKQGERE